MVVWLCRVSCNPFCPVSSPWPWFSAFIDSSWQVITAQQCGQKPELVLEMTRVRTGAAKTGFIPSLWKLTKAFTSKCHIYNIQNWLDWTVFIFSSVVVSLTSVHHHTLYHKISTSAKTLITMIVLEVLGQKATDSRLQQCCLLTLHIWHPLDESASTGFH